MVHVCVWHVFDGPDTFFVSKGFFFEFLDSFPVVDEILVGFGVFEDHVDGAGDIEGFVGENSPFGAVWFVTFWNNVGKVEIFELKPFFDFVWFCGVGYFVFGVEEFAHRVECGS